MPVVSEQEFLERLADVVKKLAGIANTQSYRFKKIWDDYFGVLNTKPHIVRSVKVDKERFLQDINYRINVLKTLNNALIDGYYSIQSILKAFYGEYINSDLFKRDFSPEDQIILKYLVARKILGDLVQYNKMDHETVPLKYNIIAREYLMIKMNGISLEDVAISLSKLNKNIARESLIKIMEEIEKDGIINIEKRGDDDYFYTLNKPLDLSKEGEKKYNETLRPLVDWPTQFWRSFYNIRELNFTTKECKFNDQLCKILSKSATQGFGPAHYVFKNLITYFEKIKNS
ncbi:MAG: hypothetical protein ACTSQP_09650 [Promethearchaeota archaeon]